MRLIQSCHRLSHFWASSLTPSRREERFCATSRLANRTPQECRLRRWPHNNFPEDSLTPPQMPTPEIHLRSKGHEREIRSKDFAAVEQPKAMPPKMGAKESLSPLPKAGGTTSNRFRGIAKPTCHAVVVDEESSSPVMLKKNSGSQAAKTHMVFGVRGSMWMKGGVSSGGRMVVVRPIQRKMITPDAKPQMGPSVSQ